MLLDAVKKMMDLVEIQDSRDPKKVRYTPCYLLPALQNVPLLILNHQQLSNSTAG